MNAPGPVMAAISPETIVISYSALWINSVQLTHLSQIKKGVESDIILSQTNNFSVVHVNADLVA